MVLQQLMEDVVGQSFVSYMNTKVLPELGMVNSTFECPLSQEHRNVAIAGYGHDKSQIEGGWHHIVGAVSGGLWSCPSDIAEFMVLISKIYTGKEKEGLYKEIAKEMLSVYPNTGFGLGFVIDGAGDELNFRKNGHNNGYHHELIMFPNRGQGVVVMTNSAVGIELINELISYVRDKLKWPYYKADFNELV